jgi:hypothetical protein
MSIVKFIPAVRWKICAGPCGVSRRHDRFSKGASVCRYCADPNNKPKPAPAPHKSIHALEVERIAAELAKADAVIAEARESCGLPPRVSRVTA